MKRRIITIVAFLAVMAAMTGLAAAADGALGKHPANVNSVCDDPIMINSNLCSSNGPGFGPGDFLHLHFILSHYDQRANNTPWIYDPPQVFRISPLPQIPVGSNVIDVKTPTTFTPNSDPYVDNPEETHHINVTVGPDVEFDAVYKIVIPVHAQNGFGNASASRNIGIFSPNTTLTKTANPSNGKAPLIVNYTYNETNTGNVNLTNVHVTDDGLAVTPVLKANGKNIGDANNDDLLNPGETWTFTSTTTFNSPGTFMNTAHGHGNPIVNGKIYQDIDVTDPKFPGEVANATVTVTNVTPCPTGECKFKTWGLLGNVANPEKKFEMLFFSPIPNGGPQGRMVVEDNKLGMTIESTEITSIVTDKNAGTGTATGRAHVTGGSHPGDYDFTVNVVDAAHSKTPRGTFELILSGFPGGYDNKGNLTFGAISIIK